MTKRIYADHSATTPLKKEVLDAMMPYLTENFGNASSIYQEGRECKKAVENARVQVAKAIGATEKEIYFTGSGSEADNWAIKGAAYALSSKGNHIISTAVELGYLDAPDGIIIDIDLINRYSPEQIVIVTTGSQGEPMSALSRMAMNDHKKVSITPMDYIIISATPIPGNEKLVTKVVNELMTLGATVIYESMSDVHVSGHACQEELKLMHALTKPKYFMPVHGEYKHLKKHAETAVGMGIPEENIIIGSNGNVIETNGEDIKITGQVAAGRVLVDGLGVGDVGSIVLRDRKHLAEDGLIIAVSTVDFENGQILSGPDIISRGFVYVRESEELMSEARNIVVSELEDALMTGNSDRNAIKTKIKDALSGFIYKKTKRSPMILPILQEL